MEPFPESAVFKAAAVGSLGCALARLGQDEREQPRALPAAPSHHMNPANPARGRERRCKTKRSFARAFACIRLCGTSERVTSPEKGGGSVPMSPNTQVALIVLILFFAVAGVSLV